MQQEMVGMML